MVRKIRVVLCGITVLATLITAAAANAQNKVVVIPLAADDITPEPFAPLTKESPPDSDYTINALTVVDSVTRLVWQRIDDNVTRDWDEAIDYCIALNLDSKSDWRLPEVAELLSLVDYGLVSPSINAVAFPSTNSGYWSASLYANFWPAAWAVEFGNGNNSFDQTTAEKHVRCVR